MKVALVCVAKNEENYIQEWIDYHLKLGFDDIIIYQNDWEYTIEQTNVFTKQVNGKGIQTIIYNDCIKENIGVYDWLAFFDCDEFLVLKKHDNVKSFLHDYNEHNAIGINWVLFGDNNLKFKSYEKVSIYFRSSNYQFSTSSINCFCIFSI